jgi:hypothetical protein
MGHRAVAALTLALALGGCKRDPAWSVTSARHPGEATLAGEPLAIPRFTPAICDGKLDDWAKAAVLGPLVEPGAGGDARVIPTFALAGWDDTRFHLAFVVRDADPVSTFSRADVDPHVWGASSGVEMMLQPGDPGDNKDYYELQVDVNGAVFDSHFDDYNAPITGTAGARTFGHQDWSSQAERAIHVEKGSFYAIEIAIPWSAFAEARVAIPPKPGDVWRMNLYSFRDGQRRALAWSPLRGQGNFHKIARFGRIRFTP